MKKISVSFMIIVLLFSQWGYAAAITSITPEDYEYSVNADGTTITITDYTGSSEVLTIPETIDGKTVTGIGDNAFSSKRLTSVEIPGGVKTIGIYAFSNNQLTSVKIQEGVTTIGERAFSMNKLTSVEIPAGVETIGNAAFQDNRLTNVTIGKEVTTIGNAAFERNKLTSVEIPAGVKTIGHNAFESNHLTTVVFQGALTLGSNVFSNQTRAYYTFDSWYKDEALTEGWTDNQILEPMTLYAKWKANYLIESINEQTLTPLTEGYTSGNQQEKAITITSAGTKGLTNLSVALSGTQKDSFIVTEQPSASLAAGNTTTLKLKAKAGLAAGTYTATVTIKADNMTAQTFMVTQIVNAAPTYLIEKINDQTLPELTEGYLSGSQVHPITITNIGTGELTELEVALVGTNASDFIVTQPSETSVTSGDSTTFTIQAKAGLAAGTYTATVTIEADNMTAETFMVTQIVNAVPTYLIEKINDQTLPELTEGYLSGSQVHPITITNIGTGKLTELEVALVGTNASDFTITQPSKTSITSGDSTTFTIQAKAGLAAGTYTATVTIEADNMAAETFVVTQIIQAAFIPTPPFSPPTVTGIVVTPAVVSLQVGEKQPFEVAEMLSDGTTRIVSTYTVTSSDSDIVTVKGNEMTAISEGTATITVAQAGYIGSVAVTVTKLPAPVLTGTIEITAVDREGTVLAKETLTHIPIGVEQTITARTIAGYTLDDAARKTVIITMSGEIAHVVFNYAIHTLPEPEVKPVILAPYIYGYPDGTFKPNAYVTRAQMATMLARFLTNGDIPKASATFNDTVNSTSRDAIEYVKKISLFKGETETIFNPNGTITRAQMATVVARWIETMCAKDDAKAYCKSVGEGKVFTDVSPNHWAASAIEKVSALGIMIGNSATTFDPNGALTRAQAVKVLNQLFERKAMTGIVKSKFSDVPRTHWAIGEIEAAATEVFVEK